MDSDINLVFQRVYCVGDTMLLKHAIFVMIAVLIVPWQKVTAEVGSRDISFGVEHHEATLALRDGFEHTLSEDPDDNSYVFQQFSSSNNETSIRIIVAKRDLQSVDNIESKHISYGLIYNSSLPLLISFDLDSIEAVDLRNVSWYWLPAAENTSLSIPVHLAPKQIGLSYLRFLIRKAKELNHTKPISWPLNTSVITSDEAYMGMLDPSELDSMSFDYVGFPIVVLRGHGVVQLIFRIAVNILVAIFTFTMGCELDPSLLKTYFWRPIGPAIGFGCQFVIMPLVSKLKWFQSRLLVKRRFVSNTSPT
ncbi:unnamed protein product [Dicrocoelium dendriticum]|nr:unnamed protein product [Dicrocoelium dendriticum]